MHKRDPITTHLWDVVAENYYRSQVHGCWNCGGWYVKHAYVHGYQDGLKKLHTECAKELKADPDYPFDEMQAWIDGAGNK